MASWLTDNDPTDPPAPKSEPVTYAAARDAYRAIPRHESQIARLRGYARMTPGMKDDYRRHTECLSRAKRLLDDYFRDSTLPHD